MRCSSAAASPDLHEQLFLHRAGERSSSCWRRKPLWLVCVSVNRSCSSQAAPSSGCNDAVTVSRQHADQQVWAQSLMPTSHTAASLQTSGLIRQNKKTSPQHLWITEGHFYFFEHLLTFYRPKDSPTNFMKTVWSPTRKLLLLTAELQEPWRTQHTVVSAAHTDVLDVQTLF